MNANASSTATTSPPMTSLQDDFGDFVSVNSAAKSAADDPISKLVSLDAFSLGSNNTKKEAPSLNQIAATKM